MLKGLAAAAALWGCATGVAAQEAPVAPATPHGADGWGMSFTEENDMFDLFDENSDRYYTQGLKLSFLSPDLKISVLEDALRDRVGLRVPVVRTTVGLGQHIYTPEELLVPVPDPRDRPYAGWAYLSAAAFAYDPGGDDLYSFEVQLGVVGPWAHAGEAQNAVHRKIKAAESLGWDHQLHNEPGLNLYGERRRIMWRADDHSAQIIGVHSLAVGTVETSVGGGLIGRVGYNLDQDFGPQRLRPGSAGADFFDGHGEAFYFFAGLHVRGVVHDVFLDGNVFHDSPSVEKKPLVPEFTAGVTWTSGRLFGVPLRFSYTHVWQGEQFVGQNGPLEYGSLTVSFTTSGLGR